MSKIAKQILIAAGLVVVLLTLALFGVNLYLQSDGVQGRIREVAGRALGSPIQIQKSHYTPWGGFVIGGISVPDPANPKAELLTAEALRFRFAWLPLLSGKVDITEVRLEKPVLIARQSEERKWAVLVPPPPARDIPVTLPEGGAAVAPGKPGKSFQVSVRAIRVKEAKIVFIDRTGRTLLRVENAEANARLAEDLTTTGDFKIPQMEISHMLRPRGLRGTFTWDGSAFDLPDLEGMLAGGRLRGTYHLDTRPGTRFRATVSVEDAKLKKLAEEAGGVAEGTAGTLKAAAELAGDPADPDSIEGWAVMDMFEARLRPVDFLVQFGTMFGIDELQMLELSEATSRFTIRDGRVLVDKILMRSENLVLSGTGSARFDGQLEIDAALQVNKKLQRQLRAVLSDNFKETGDPEYRRLDFSVTNTLANPQTDLLDKLVGAKIGQDVGGLLRNIFGGPAPEKKKKKPKKPKTEGGGEASGQAPEGGN